MGHVSNVKFRDNVSGAMNGSIWLVRGHRYRENDLLICPVKISVVPFTNRKKYNFRVVFIDAVDVVKCFTGK